MSVRIEFTEPALADISSLHEYIAQFDQIAAERVVRRIFAAGASLAEFPERGRRGLRRGTRELLSVRPFVIVYEVSPDAVRILRVWHGAQDRSSGEA